MTDWNALMKIRRVPQWLLVALLAISLTAVTGCLDDLADFLSNVAADLDEFADDLDDFGDDDDDLDDLEDFFDDLF